jgi:hypothetical protein
MATATPAVPGIRPFTAGLRSPVIAPVTRGLLGIPLLFLTTHTDTFFAWTIGVPMTAAVLGSNYWSSAALAIAASKKRVWSQGRISVSVALMFAPITTIATFLHLDQFHFTGKPVAVFFGWFWTIAYGFYVPLLIFLLARQLKVPGVDPPREVPLPRPIRVLFAAEAAILIPVGILMFFAPGFADHWFPWQVVPLTSQALSAWAMAFGVLALQAVWENDLERVHVALIAYPVLAILHTIAVIRFHDELRWDEPGAYVYLAFIVSWYALSVWGYLANRSRTFSEWVEPEAETANQFRG